MEVTHVDAVRTGHEGPAHRVVVELDGRRTLVLDATDAARLGLVEGATVDADLLAQAESAARRTTGLDAAARLLARRSSSRAEISRSVARHADAATAEEVASTLVAHGLIDDAAHARAVVERRLAAGWGPERIEHDLAAAGIERATADAALAAIDRAALLAAARVALGGREGAAGWRRLAARGFDEDVAEDVLPGALDPSDR